MDSQRLSVEEVFLRAVEEDPARRQAFLDTACADGTVRTRVEALLRAHDNAGAFLSGPAVRRTSATHGESAAPDEALDFLGRCDTPGRLGVLGHYEILDVLGRGGMGIVLRGVDVKLGRVAAIKVLAPTTAANATARQRFLREAQAAAAVSHDHVVRIHAVDEFNGLPYLAMEYVSGPSLQQKIDAGGPLELAPILRIGMQIASGLAAAHAQGLVHRDIKPANILLENGIERVRITDFGLARSIDDVRITQAGAVYGTPQYMSPEQAQGERVDQRSDLFSLGGVMYAMSTGRPPFRGDTGLAVLKRVCEEAPRPIREVNPAIPPALAAIIDRLLAKDPGARFQTAAEVAELLGRFLAHVRDDPHSPFQGGGEMGRPLQRNARSPRRRALVVGGAVLLVAIAILTVLEGARLTNLTGRAEPRASARKDDEVIGINEKQSTTSSAERPVKVFILAGDYNMAGRATAALLQYQANQPKTKEHFRHLLNDGKWVEREDVWVKNFNQKGNLTVGFGHTPDRFGPELEFGNVVGDHYEEQVLLIKTCCGDSLGRDFRSPGAGAPSQKVLELRLRDLQKVNAGLTLADAEKSFGAAYRQMLTEIRETLANLGEHFPGYRGQGFEIAGFVWFQAWNDLLDPYCNPLYAEHLTHLIRDVRSDLKSPKLPFVIGQLGVRGVAGVEMSDLNLRAAQASVAQLPEFAGNVRLVATDPFWDHEAHAALKRGTLNNQEELDRIVSDAPYRYLGSPKTFCSIGRAFGEAMIELCRSNAKP